MGDALAERLALPEGLGLYGAPFLWVQGKALVGTMWQSSQKLQGFSTEIAYFWLKYTPPETVMKLIQPIFFKNLAKI